MRMDVSEGNALALRYDNRQALRIDPKGALVARRLNTKSLALGRATMTQIQDGRAEVVASRMQLRVEGDEASRLIRLDGGAEGEIVVLESESAGIRVASDPAGNLRLKPAFVFEDTDARLVLMKAGDSWVELSRSGVE